MIMKAILKTIGGEGNCSLDGVEGGKLSVPKDFETGMKHCYDCCPLKYNVYSIPV